ncbi:helix-turn-helix domain-containing protein [Massilia luteola]|uniref:MarR family transcriptional regulator n=1 Tax=Massilia luteola TaxID=3081751 RepID=UPI002ACBEB0E|nr:helix-turn-helix domain-containing protein [Massilia sp. Gc5]
MAQKKLVSTADPQPGSDFATIVRTPVTRAARFNGRGSFLWCFCKLCGQQTEYSVALESVSVFKRISNGAIKVPLSDEVRAKAQRLADDLVTMYQLSLEGSAEVPSPGKILLAYCDIREMRGDFSIDSFRDQVERHALIAEWAKLGDMPGAVRLSGNPKGAQRPSKLYCALHYPRRSDDARRAYQRDRRFIAEYEELIREFWRQYAGYLRQWNIDDHAMVRHAAYHHLRIMKAPTRLLDEFSFITKPENKNSKPAILVKPIEAYYMVARAAHQKIRRMRKEKDCFDELEERGSASQAEIARHLGINRQAVSAALKRKRVVK